MENKHILDSWKEICAYLKRSEKTCRKWEHDLDLPIHRIEDSPKARVFAYKDELDHWMAKTQHSEKKSFIANVSIKKLLIPALVTIILLIIAIAIWQPWSRKEITLPSSDKPSLAVVYFENNSGDENLDYWRSALSELLITDLSQSKFIHVVSGNRIFSILKKLNLLEAKKYSSEDLKEIANHGRATHLIKGSYMKVGEKFIITAMLQKPHTEEVISSTKLECTKEEEIMQKIDELTKKIKLDLNFSRELITADIDREVGKITTSSLEAYRFYSKGRTRHRRGNRKRSIQFMEEAVAIDPEFAMAYRSMGVEYWNQGLTNKARKYFRKAFELSEQASDRERFSIQALFYGLVEDRYDKAIAVYNALLDVYPDDFLGNHNLGVSYQGFEEWDKAIECHNVNKENNTDSVWTYMNLTFGYMNKGLYEKAIEVIEFYINNFPDNAEIHRHLARVYLILGNYELAFAEADKAFLLDPLHYQNSLLKGDIYQCRGDLTQAEKEYQKVLTIGEQAFHLHCSDKLGALYLLQGKYDKSKDQIKQGVELAKKLRGRAQEARFHLLLAYEHLKSGKAEKALEESEEAWACAVEDKTLYWWPILSLHSKGITCVEMGSVDKAERAAAELKELIDKGMNRKIIRLYYHLMGMIELERKNSSIAIKWLTKAVTLLRSQYYNIKLDEEIYYHVLLLDPLASAYYETGDLEKAREEYEKIVALTTGRLYYGDIYAKSFYKLGKIYEQTGQQARAIDNYKKFLDLWKDADPGLVEVEGARERLAGLKE